MIAVDAALALAFLYNVACMVHSRRRRDQIDPRLAPRGAQPRPAEDTAGLTIPSSPPRRGRDAAAWRPRRSYPKDFRQRILRAS